MIGSFLIFLREGIEGSMIVSIMCTYLAAAGRRDLFRWVFAGVAAALIGSAAIGIGMYILVKDAFIGSTAQTWFETGTFLVAVIILTYMTFWMKRHSRSISSNMKEQMNVAVTDNSGLALATIAFVTVGREAIETAIFLLAIAFQTSPFALLIGAVVGLAVSLSASFAMYRAGVRLNLKRLFTGVGVALLVIAAGLLANAIQNLQELGTLPGASQVIWNTGHWISDDSPLGDVLHGLLGYAASPTVLQVAVWAIFLAIGLAAFLDKPKHVLARIPVTHRG